MTKFSPELCTWSAIHTDKTVNHPNYADIDRSKLLEFQLLLDDVIVYSAKKPLNKPFKLFARLRTFDYKGEGTGKKVWVVGNNIPPLRYDVIDGETVENCKEFRGNHAKYDAVRFREDEL